MKRITVYAIVLSILTLFIAGCSNDKENHGTIILPVISLKGRGEEISPEFYEKGFDFKYENLPAISLAGNEGILQIKLSEGFPNKVVIGEDYYNYTETKGTVYKETYELEKDNNNIILLPIKRRGNVKDEEAVYYISSGNKDNKEIFVFKVILPIAEIEEGENAFTNDDVTTIFENNREINNYDINDYEILDSILVDDKSTQIKAIILFDDKKTNNSCNLAFIVKNMDKENVVQEITFAVNDVEGIRDFEIDNGAHLIYKENGAVTLPIREIKTNEVFDITVIYSHQEPDEINFKIISNKHTE